ncbi:hypothetical protein T01_3260 [Trichinella spiralis]|uniref:Uncharacterized protein n=1 Tax=Trichinella spiralis TaxID=6334 RepID=A0A0V1BPK1_TRISP|nr:hypothetical protein T01_3260 [Trichinella spiralis]
MGGVGLLDRQIGAYRPTIRDKNGISLCSFINALKVAAVRSKSTSDSSTLSQLPELLDIRFDGNHRGAVNCRSMCKADEAQRTCQENTMFVFTQSGESSASKFTIYLNKISHKSLYVDVYVLIYYQNLRSLIS